MADDELQMTWDEKVDHAAITLVVPAFILWAAVEVSARPEAAGRYAGAVLELFGFVVAAYGLQEKVAQVTDRPGLRERVSGWLGGLWRRVKRMFGWEPEGRTIRETLSDSVGFSDSIQTDVTAAPDAPLDHRIEILEQEVEALGSRIDEVEREAREARAELEDEVAAVSSDLREVEEDLEDLIRRLAIGSLHWEATGLLWFAVGVLVAAWPGAIPGV